MKGLNHPRAINKRVDSECDFLVFDPSFGLPGWRKTFNVRNRLAGVFLTERFVSRLIRRKLAGILMLRSAS